MTNITIDRIHAIGYHRNGICGTPFYAIVFDDAGTEGSRKVAVIFDEPGYVAVLDLGKLADGNVAFGQNSWRGDRYEPPLRRAIGQSFAGISAESCTTTESSKEFIGQITVILEASGPEAASSRLRQLARHLEGHALEIQFADHNGDIEDYGQMEAECEACIAPASTKAEE